MLPWVLRALGRRVARAVWGVIGSRRFWAVALGSLPFYGSSDHAREHAPGFADAMATSLARFLFAAVLAVILAIGLMIFARWYRNGSTLYERINAEALGISVIELRELWAAERRAALLAAAEPWADDRIKR